MRSRPVREGEVLTLEVTSLADGPDALALVGDYVLFLPGALPGERVRARVTHAGRKFGRAILLSVEKPSPARVAPRCPHFGVCGGCHFQHLDYRAQLAHKTARLRKQLVFSLKRSDLPIAEMVGPPDPWGQRNKIALHLEGRAGAPIAGLYKMRSREVIPIRECPVSDPAGMELAFRAREMIREEAIEAWRSQDDRGALRALVVRTSSTGERSLTLVARRRHLPRAERLAKKALESSATGVALNVNERPGPALLGRETIHLGGKPRLRERIGEVTYLSSPGAFFQTSRWGAETLVGMVTRLAKSPPRSFVVDLYSGGGLFSLALAAGGAEVVGIEENRDAVADAEASARMNRFRSVRFLTGKAEWRMRELFRSGRPVDTVVLDPPREGAAPAVLDALARLNPQRVIYVSCDPASLGRDLAHLEDRGYRLRSVEPLDMFPHAFHIEAVALLTPAAGQARRSTRRRLS